MVAVSGVSNYSPVNYVNFKGKTEKVDKGENIDEMKAVNAEIPEDSFEAEHKAGKRALTKADKQEIIAKARTTAVGWSIIGGTFSTLYYALRSDDTIAEKYDLDKKQDKKLIKKIRTDQTIGTLAGACLPFIGGLAAYIYCKNQDPEDIEVH